jgi:hypothetical protein
MIVMEEMIGAVEMSRFYHEASLFLRFSYLVSVSVG